MKEVISNNNYLIRTPYYNQCYASHPLTEFQMVFPPPQANVTRILPFLATEDEVVDCGVNVLANVSYCPPRFGYAIEGICTCLHPVPFY